MTCSSRKPAIGDCLPGSPEAGWVVPAGWSVRTTRGSRPLWAIASPVWRVVRTRLGPDGIDVVVAPFRG